MAKVRTKRISKAQRQKQRQRAQVRRRLTWIGVVAVALVLVGFVAFRQASRPSIGQSVPSLGNQHISPELVGSVVYNSTPPTSGPHLPQLANWGVHTEPIPNELQVHNLEDGGVMVQYNCDDCGDLVSQLTSLVRRYPEHVVLAPYPDMDSRVALTAWGRIDKLDQFDSERIRSFIDAYAGVDHHVAGP
jgi:hypothetical protein